MELWEYWVGRIKDIRAELDKEGTNTVGSVFLRDRLRFSYLTHNRFGPKFSGFTVERMLRMWSSHCMWKFFCSVHTVFLNYSSDPSSVTDFERIYADHYDFVESQAFDGTSFSDMFPFVPLPCVQLLFR